MRLFFVISLVFSFNSLSQKVPELSEIMKGSEFIGFLPENVQWSVDGEKLYFEKDTKDDKQHFAYSLKKKTTDSINKKDIVSHGINNRKLYARELLYSLMNGKLIQLNSSGDAKPLLSMNKRIYNVQHVLNEKRVYFQLEGDLYMFDVKNNYFTQVSQVENRNESNKSEDYDYLSIQEKQLFIDRGIKKRDQDKEKSLANITIGDMTLQSLQISPNEKFIAYRLSKTSQPPYTDVMNYLSEDGFAKVQKARPKVGTVSPPEMKFGIYSFATDSSILIDFSFLPGIRTAPKYYEIYDRERELDKDKPLIVHEGVFSPDGSKILISIKSFDNKDRWILSYDLAQNKSTLVDHQHDEAWIGGPGISSWNYSSGTLGWINNEQIYFQSEKTGFSHLYRFDLKEKKVSALTEGKWEVHSAILSSDSKTFYITANKSHSGNRSFYHLDVLSREIRPILTRDGAYEIEISPDEKTLAFRYSFMNKPWEVYICKNKAGAEPIQITHSTTSVFKAFKWISPDIVDIPTENGLNSKARVYSPADSVNNGAAVIFVHGAGYLQNAHNYWSGYYREYMFHHILLSQGFTVLDIDYRASKGYGRNHRTAIYRHMGKADLDDQLHGKKWLVQNLNIDPERVGIYGGSYGGFITLMALFKHPGEFKCGGALRSVTDWAHYNHPYTSNILNTPDLDSIAYKRSSPIYFADGLEDRLIMFHGMVDDNVQYQDIIRLSQRLIELGKEDWDLANYPIEAHSFSTPTSWTDEYRRLLKMFNTQLLK